jgi:hypothetical protein
MADESTFDIAAEEARKQLDALYKELSPEEKKVFFKIVAWWRNNFMSSGHKRLGRIIANFK